MIIDIVIILFAISSLYRGREIGFVRQLFSTAGFFGGLFLGAWLERYTVTLAHSPASRATVSLLTTLSAAMALLIIGEYIGFRLKHKVIGVKALNHYDNGFGSLLSLVSLLFGVWLLASIVISLPFNSLQQYVKASHIVSFLNQKLPQAPNVIADIGHLIEPNGFPQVFIGSEPIPRGKISLPALGDLQTAVNLDKASVVKLQGQGCGGIVEGSGFVAAKGFIATNAHVVAGIAHPYVQDQNGTHTATPVWFDPNLDLAVLRVSNLAGAVLPITQTTASTGTAAVALGYPGGGSFTATAAAVLDSFTANGRNIYDKGNTNRQVYELQADIIPGNSGGPLVAKDGSVIGVIFAQSTSYQHVGYALNTPQVVSEINQATAQNKPVSTGECAE